MLPPATTKDDPETEAGRALQKTDSLHQLTVVPFEHHLFDEVLKKQLAALLHFADAACGLWAALQSRRLVSFRVRR